jgi:hypothetical protein
MVHLDIDRPDDACLRIVGDLAEQFDAKLIGVAAADLESSYYEQGVFAQELFE